MVSHATVEHRRKMRTLCEITGYVFNCIYLLLIIQWLTSDCVSAQNNAAQFQQELTHIVNNFLGFQEYQVKV